MRSLALKQKIRNAVENIYNHLKNFIFDPDLIIGFKITGGAVKSRYITVDKSLLTSNIAYINEENTFTQKQEFTGKGDGSDYNDGVINLTPGSSVNTSDTVFGFKVGAQDTFKIDYSGNLYCSSASSTYIYTSDKGIAVPTNGSAFYAYSFPNARLNFSSTPSPNYEFTDLTGSVVHRLYTSGASLHTGECRANSGFNHNGTSGTTTTATFITNIRIIAGPGLEAKTKTVTYSGGIVTNVSAESGWTSLPF